MHDLVIRGGTVVDGLGGEPFVADVAIDGDRVSLVGTVAAQGREEIDAFGKFVTPGFVDVHTHYDAGKNAAHRRCRNPCAARRSARLCAG